MIRSRNLWLLILILLISFFPMVNQSYAQEPVVHAVLFYSTTCGHCKIVIEEVLPDLDARYGTQLQIYGVNTHTDIGDHLFENFILSYNIPPEDQVVPILLVGDQILIGSQQIPEMLPGIIDEGLLKKQLVEPLLKEANELTAIFIASRKTARGD